MVGGMQREGGRGDSVDCARNRKWPLHYHPLSAGKSAQCSDVHSTIILTIVLLATQQCSVESTLHCTKNLHFEQTLRFMFCIKCI